MTTPSEASKETAPFTDKRGRSFAIKKMTTVDRWRFGKLMGPVTNPIALGGATLAYHVVSIDGEDVAKPTTEAQLEFLLQRLDEDGIDALGPEVAKLYPEGDAEQQKADVKN